MRKGRSRRHRRVESLRLAAAGLLAALAAAGPAEPAHAQSYRAYVAAESEDEVAVLEFTPEGGLTVEKVIRVGAGPPRSRARTGCSSTPPANTGT